MIDYINTGNPCNEPENECSYCGYKCHGTFCSDACRKADYIENCHD